MHKYSQRPARGSSSGFSRKRPRRVRRVYETCCAILVPWRTKHALTEASRNVRGVSSEVGIRVLRNHFVCKDATRVQQRMLRSCCGLCRVRLLGETCVQKSFVVYSLPATQLRSSVNLQTVGSRYQTLHFTPSNKSLL